MIYRIMLAFVLMCGSVIAEEEKTTEEKAADFIK
jgi:hypothetical protein